MGDLWGTRVFRRGGEGLEGANRKEKSGKNQKFIFSIGTALELTLNLFKTEKSLRKSQISKIAKKSEVKLG